MRYSYLPILFSVRHFLINTYSDTSVKDSYFLVRSLPILFINMPQFIPFYFVSQFSFAFLTLMATVYLIGTYALPVITELYVSRMYITKL